MDIEKIIRVWKAEEDEWEAALLANPVGQELTEEEMLHVCGGDCFITECTYTCNITCTVTICVGSVCSVTDNCTVTHVCPVTRNGCVGTIRP
jgi:hypothetical protein